MPYTAGSEMIKQLKLLGNKDAELIKINFDNRLVTVEITESLTDINENELLVWLLEQLKIQQ